MKFLKLLGLGFLVLSGVLFYAEQKRTEGEEDFAGEAVMQILASQNRTVSARLDEALQRADRDAAEVLSRWRRKPKMRSFLTDTALSEPNAPKWILVADRRIRAAGNVGDGLLEDALEEHVNARHRFGMFVSKGKPYLLVKGSIEGQPYVSAYSPDTFFQTLRTQEGSRIWLTLSDGTVIYHPLIRFIGSSASNIRPVAAGLQDLTAGKSITFAQKYLGLEGKDALGSWITLPSHGVLAASEWPKPLSNRFGLSLFLWISLSAGVMGAFVLGLSLRRAPSVSKVEPLFDESRLDSDAMEYLESARSSAERAVEYAKQQEDLVSEARRERLQAIAMAKSYEKQLSMQDQFLDKILFNITEKQVWTDIARLIGDQEPGLILIVYRYASSSFSLVPESVVAKTRLPENAVAYLRDARIFIGNTSFLDKLVNTEAFSKWNKARLKHMPMMDAQFRAFPYSGQGIRGVVLAVFDSSLNAEAELEPSLQVLETYIKRAGTFCDSLGRLLQSMYAKGNAWPTVASAPNDARNRPRPS